MRRNPDTVNRTTTINNDPRYFNPSCSCWICGVNQILSTYRILFFTMDINDLSPYLVTKIYRALSCLFKKTKLQKKSNKLLLLSNYEYRICVQIYLIAKFACEMGLVLFKSFPVQYNPDTQTLVLLSISKDVGIVLL